MHVVAKQSGIATHVAVAVLQAKLANTSEEGMQTRPTPKRRDGMGGGGGEANVNKTQEQRDVDPFRAPVWANY